MHACFDTVIADRGFESESESEIIFTKPMPCHSQDINECDTTNGRCEHSCTNTIGSFICSCDTGYQLDGNGLSCNGEGLLKMKVVYACFHTVIADGGFDS